MAHVPHVTVAVLIDSVLSPAVVGRSVVRFIVCDGVNHLSDLKQDKSHDGATDNGVI